MEQKYGQCKTFGWSLWRIICKWFSELSPKKGWILTGFSASKSILKDCKNIDFFVYSKKNTIMWAYHSRLRNEG